MLFFRSKSDRTILKDIPGIGRVRFVWTRRARRLNLTVRPPAIVRIAMPHGVAEEQALRFLRSHTEWIRHHLERLRQTDLFDSSTALRGEIPNHREAAASLTERLHELANRHGLSIGRVSIRNQRTRWGSCSVRNTISLNIRLAQLPDDLRDYVLLHELAHTRVKHHGPSFWEYLETLLPNAREYRRRLRSYHLS